MKVKVKRIIFFIFFILAVYFNGAAEGVKIKLLYYSRQDLQNNPAIKYKSQGIPTVPVGQTVYLQVDAGALEIVTCKWTVEAPDSGSAELSDPAATAPTLVLLKEGQYKVIATITSGTGGSYTAGLWVTAGGFVGNGAVVDTGNKAQCRHCHREIMRTWETTPHAGAFRRGLAGKLAYGYYRVYCFYCHRPGADNTKVWAAMEEKEDYHLETKPDGSGLAEFLRDSPDAANLAGVQCESCHGPGSQHLGKIDKNQVSDSVSPGVCVMCHDSDSSPQGSILKGKGGMAFGTEVYSTGQHSRVKKNCAGCHMAKSPAEFVQRVGGHTFRVITKDQGEPVLNTAGCKDCHDTMNLEMVGDSREKIKRLLKELAGLLPHRQGKSEVPSEVPWAEPKVPQDPSLSKVEAAASYNYYTIIKDGSFGVHNPVYIKALLDVSIAALKGEKKSR